MSTHKATEPLPGSLKVIEAIRDLNYKGKTILGRRRERIDLANKGYDVTLHPGEIVEIDDQGLAREIVDSGKGALLSGGFCSVVTGVGLPRYIPWSNQMLGEPRYEDVEILRGLSFFGLILPAGFRCKMDTNLYDRSQFHYEDEPRWESHQLRVLKPSPKKLRISAAEQAQKVDALFTKFFPAATTQAV